MTSCNILQPIPARQHLTELLLLIFPMCTQATAAGLALDLDRDYADAQGSATSVSKPLDGADDTKVNMWDGRHRNDPGPMVAGCRCFLTPLHVQGLGLLAEGLALQL